MSTLDLILNSIAVMLNIAEVVIIIIVVRPRFSLRAVLVSMTAIALFLGMIYTIKNLAATH